MTGRARGVLGGLVSAALLLLASYVAASTAKSTLATRDGTLIVALLATSVAGCFLVAEAARRVVAAGRRARLARHARNP